MMIRHMAVAAFLAIPMVAQAETPNVTPGEWEFVSVTSMSGDMQIPDQTQTERQCITQEELDSAEFGFIEEEEGCELLSQDMNADGLSYSMICRADGGEATIDGEMRFMGEQIEGNVDIFTQSPMGELNMNTVIEGERIGNCD
ncbi:DUF3617 domain-containing protein [Vreelandella venusta]|nr:DUF3617 family protein [Halomonas venusta]MDW0360609.1 DUF3617 family protein [Halomonas venusta]MDX1714496.1 DUF3617 family protein [Halomonas venusta]QPI65288.1 DUF3617 family protein [Halomonas venusta]UQI41857.1 DUF3617 domain-containing protein [Halomonas venusta]WAM56718.1 DUF3617 domain-containing protein [Halomonas venusta]